MKSYQQTNSSKNIVKNTQIIQQGQNQSNAAHREPFHLSFKVDKILYTQGSPLGAIIDRLIIDKHLGLTQKQIEKLENRSNLDNTNKCLFQIQLFQVGQKTQKMIASSLAIGQVQQTSSTLKLYEYPVDLTEIDLKCQNQVCSFVSNFSPEQIRQFKLVLGLRTTNEQNILIGQTRIDPNLFIQICLDEGINCVSDSKKLSKRIQNDKQINQQIQIEFEVYVESERTSLQRAMAEHKTGIKVLDFKEHIRKILEQRHQAQNHSNNQNQTSKQQENINGNHNIALQQLQYRKNSLRQKYLTYLRQDIEQNLHYHNPTKKIIENQVEGLMKSQKKAAQRQLQTGQYKVKQKGGNTQKATEKTQAKGIKQNKCHNQAEKFKTTVNGSEEWGISEKVKLMLFIVVSCILLYLAMTPSQNHEQKI